MNKKSKKLALGRAGLLSLGIIAGKAVPDVSHVMNAAEPAAVEPARAPEGYNLSDDKVALKGYDPVSYFTQQAALPGRKEISAEYHGVTYYFANDKNRQLFTAAPAMYLLAYGGWCATAMAKGKKVQIDPKSFKVTNGRLFLFYNGLLGSAINDWNKDEAGLTTKADANWKKLSSQ
jgi:YHS domain-containing protein